MEIQQQKIKWVKTWQTAALSLKNIKRNELQAFDYYEKNRILLDEMLQYACDNSKKRLFSGLVEQQRIFKKLYKNKNVKERQ
ncbi:MAG: hypothetical protein V2I97_00430 [Desulfococcaceae bacterium]|jgi:hypothetical protein|nr:hypothetical protein [Desulfococcaceae bacterium]